MQTDRRTANIDRDALALIFERVSQMIRSTITQLIIFLAPRKSVPTE
jgi:hypothetical protein